MGFFIALQYARVFQQEQFYLEVDMEAKRQKGSQQVDRAFFWNYSWSHFSHWRRLQEAKDQHVGYL